MTEPTPENVESEPEPFQTLLDFAEKIAERRLGDEDREHFFSHLREAAIVQEGNGDPQLSRSEIRDRIVKLAKMSAALDRELAWLAHAGPLDDVVNVAPTERAELRRKSAAEVIAGGGLSPAAFVSDLRDRLDAIGQALQSYAQTFLVDRRALPRNDRRRVAVIWYLKAAWEMLGLKAEAKSQNVDGKWSQTEKGGPFVDFYHRFLQAVGTQRTRVSGQQIYNDLREIGSVYGNPPPKTGRRSQR